jgi:hypothetical protein
MVVCMGMAVPAFAHAQTDAGIEAGGHVAVLRLSEFDTTDAGIGVHATWRATPIVSLDGALTWFPGGDTASLVNRVARQERTLGLMGARSGIRRGPFELFGRARIGFLRFGHIDQAVCVAVTTVPLPLECHIATGYTAFATDLGGGIALDVADRLQLRTDIGDLMVRYGIKAHRSNGEPTDGFTSHNMQFSSGLVWRF